MAADIIGYLLTATTAMTTALLLVALLRQPLRRWLGARAGYALWLAVPVAVLAAALPGPSASPAATLNPVRISLQAMTALQPRATSEQSAGWLLLWAAGAALTLAWQVRAQRRFQRHVGVLRKHADGSVRSDHLATPALVGLWQPRIVLPGDFEQRYSPAEQALVLAHEQAHRQHGDPWANASAAGLLCLFWFNPLLYWALGRFRFDQELACDARVLEAAPHARQPYAHALLKTQLNAEAAWPLPVGCHWQSCHPLMERITMLSQSPTSATRRRSGVALALVLCLTGSYAVWAAQPDATGSKTAPRQLKSVQDEDIVTGIRYPKSALDQKIAGDVALLVQVLPDGSVGEVIVESSTPTGVFDAATLEAARKWKFNPERRDGNPVVGWIKVPVHFDPTGDPDKREPALESSTGKN